MARRTSSWWILIAVAVVGVIVVRGGACRAGKPAPDQRLATHLQRMCDIAGDGIADPVTGVRRLLRYHAEHGPAMAEAMAATLVAIEAIEDDADHDARARLARDRIAAPVHVCRDTWERFGSAVERDPEASAIIERAGERFGRTLDILLGGRGAARLLDGPEQWLRALSFP